LIDCVSSDYAIKQDGVSLLHTKRVSLNNLIDDDRGIELIKTVKNGHTEMAKTLIDSGASLDL
jgi:hypothetical protein